MLPVPHEINSGINVPHELNPGIDDACPVAVIAQGSVLRNTDIVPVPSGVEGSPVESEIAPNKAGFLPQVEAKSMCKEVTLRKSFSIKEKHKYIVAINALIAIGASCRQACAIVNLPHNYYPGFKKVLSKIDELDKNDEYVPFKMNGTARKIHPGNPSLLQDICIDLSRLVFEIR